MDAQGVALVDVVKAVEGLGSGAVRGCEPGDVRDVVVHLNCRLATMRRAVGDLGEPGVTLQDEYALEVILRAVRTMATGNELWVVERAVEYLDERMLNWRGRRNKGRWNRSDERAVEMVMRMFSVLVTRRLPAKSGPVGQNR
jgi:hypothetical protein